jgi:hypothetical protein
MRSLKPQLSGSSPSFGTRQALLQGLHGVEAVHETVPLRRLDGGEPGCVSSGSVMVGRASRRMLIADQLLPGRHGMSIEGERGPVDCHIRSDSAFEGDDGERTSHIPPGPHVRHTDVTTGLTVVVDHVTPTLLESTSSCHALADTQGLLGHGPKTNG